MCATWPLPFSVAKTLVQRFVCDTISRGDWGEESMRVLSFLAALLDLGGALDPNGG